MNQITELRQLRRLKQSVQELIQIVEGASSVRWEFDGTRLKDTEEWCKVFCKFHECKTEKKGQ